MNPKRFRYGFAFTLVSSTSQARSRSVFTVIATNGIHRVNLDFCNCKIEAMSEDEKVQEYNRQLLEVGWWPSTNTEPQSAATLDLLHLFQLLNLNGALSPTEFYRSLQDLTDPEGLIDTPKNRREKEGEDDFPVGVSSAPSLAACSFSV